MTSNRKEVIEPAAFFCANVLTEYTYDTLGNLVLEAFKIKSVDYK